jgi:hypothetical protein
METKNEDDTSHDKQFTRTKVNAIVRNTEKVIIKELVNNVINEFNVFIHNTDCICKYKWEYSLKCHIGITSLILFELQNYFEHDMVSVMPTGDPFTVSVLISW